MEKLYSFFCPARWEYALKHVDECLTYPCVTLAQVNGVYNSLDAVQNIIKGMFIGIYSLSTARDEYNQQASTLASDMFIAKYGHECTLYDSMLYFANYLLEYKGSYAQYDVQDILLQFSKKYIPWKRLKLQNTTDAEKPKEKENVLTVEMLVRIWLQEGRTNELIKSGGLYQTGIITDKMIQQAERDLESGVFI